MGRVTKSACARFQLAVLMALVAGWMLPLVPVPAAQATGQTHSGPWCQPGAAKTDSLW